MRTVNRVFLLGNVGHDPEIKSTSSGTVIANFSLATGWAKSDKTSVTEWHRLVAFKRAAEVIRDYVVKGTRLYVEGQLRTHSWDDGGTKRYTTEVIVLDLSLLDSRAANTSKAAALNGCTSDGAITKNFGLEEQAIAMKV